MKRILFIGGTIGVIAGFALQPSHSYAETVPRFDKNAAWQYLIKQVNFGPRNPGSVGHQKCRRFLVEKLRQFAEQVVEQPFMHYDDRTQRTITLTNIIARFFVKKNRRIMLAAHWDTRPMADRDPNPENRDKPILGANDGASGVAVLLEVARQLASSSPPVGVDIVLFDGEDFGKEGQLNEYFLGSRYFVENNQWIFPDFAILLDMVGDVNLHLPIEANSQNFAPDVVNWVWQTAQKLGFYQFDTTVNGAINDDHVILNEAGIPAIDIIDFQYPDASHRFWHTLADTPDKCSPESLQAVGQVLLEIIYHSEGSP